MNRTININLGGMFFHIDEEAFSKLQHYLNTIKRSFSDSQGRDEIIADIEARIAELFSERLVNERQVVSITDVNEVITIMGQPEDYMVDEEIFEDEAPRQSKKAKNPKQLLRDPDNKYIAGVSSGLAYYLGIDAVWVRLLWVLLLFASFFTIIIVYIIFWIVMPEATTTAQKLSMRGEPVNISNIEKKVKEGFDDVTERVKNVDYEKVGRKVKSGSQTFFESLGNVLLSILKVIGKFFGLIIIFVAASTLISLLIGMFALGSTSFMQIPPVDHLQELFLSGTPVWFVALSIFFAVGIPFFFLFILGLKILVSNLKPIGNIAKYSLLGVWILSILGLVYFGLKKASETSTTTTISEKEPIEITKMDTLTIIRNDQKNYNNISHSNGVKYIEIDEEQMIYGNNIRVDIRSTRDSLGYVSIHKQSEGGSLEEAKENANDISYSYTFDNNTLALNDYLLTHVENAFFDQTVYVIVYIPADTHVILDYSTRYMLHDVDNNFDVYDKDMTEHSWKMGKEILQCIDCATLIDEEDEEIEIKELEALNKQEETNPNSDPEPVLEVEELKASDSE